MLTARFAPAAMAKGNVSPLTLNPAPVVLAEKTVTLELPVFDKVLVSVALLPTRTLPNARLVGDALSKNVGGADAVPASGMVGKLLEALLTSERLPLNVPAA